MRVGDLSDGVAIIKARSRNAISKLPGGESNNSLINCPRMASVMMIRAPTSSESVTQKDAQDKQ